MSAARVTAMSGTHPTSRLKRLDEHNAGTGADATRGEQWRYFAVLTGFSDRRTALRFESLMHLHRVTDVREWLDVARPYPRNQGGAVIHNAHSPNLMICDFSSRELNDL